MTARVEAALNVHIDIFFDVYISIDVDVLVTFHLRAFACFHLSALVSALGSTALVTTPAFARRQFNQYWLLRHCHCKPDRYVLYNCTQLAAATQATRSRQRKLEMLMAKAETDSVEVIVSSAAHRPEYADCRV